MSSIIRHEASDEGRAEDGGLPLTDSAAEHLARGSGPRGRIEVSAQAIATIAGRAVADCYGVVGVAARRPRLGTVELLAPEHYRRGVQLHFTGDGLIIDLYVVLEFGLRVSEIALNIMNTVTYAVEQSLGVRVRQVNVNVQALRMSREP